VTDGVEDGTGFNGAVVSRSLEKSNTDANNDSDEATAIMPATTTAVLFFRSWSLKKTPVDSAKK
jgi:hypothetical protein